MILTDYLTQSDELMARWAKQLGVNHAVIRLPEDGAFDPSDLSHWKSYYRRFEALGLRPIVVEPMPVSIYEPIKCGAPDADEAIARARAVVRNMGVMRIPTLCVNFMAHIGWYRTRSDYPLRGGALGTAFSMADFAPKDDFSITEEQLWRNLEHFLREILPVCEESDVRLALHPDDPPVPRLGGVSRILTSLEAIDRAVHLVESDCLGVTLCQGCYAAMGEDVCSVIRHFARQDKLFFVHFRDVSGTREDFHECFHDDGMTDMARAVRTYQAWGYRGPIRVDHVPTMAGERADIPGYANMGRLYAIGYLKGLLEASGYAFE